MPNRLAPLLLASLLAAPALAAQQAAEPLTLEQALELAAANHETGGIAAARLERAQAFRRQALAQLVPSLTISGTYTRRAEEVTRVIDGDEVTVQAIDALAGQAVVESTLLDLRALPLIRAAGSSLEAQAAESEELRRALAFDVADTYFAALSAERLLGAARRRVEVAAATVEESTIRLEAGLANRNDRTRTELELATARLEVTQAESLVTSTRLALGFLIGLPLEAGLLEPDPPPIPEGDRDALIERARRASRELVALERRAAAARQSALAPRLGIVPTLDLRGLYRLTNEEGLSGRDEDWNVALNLGWALFDGGDRAALAAQRDAEAREAELVFERRRREIAVEVEAALADLTNAEAGRSQAAVRLEVAGENAEEVRERFKNGLATALEQADALVARFEAEAEVERQRFAVARARLALERAVGLWPAALEPTAATQEIEP
ncbi:MAG: hypothetical protein AMXMBFR36_13170 [Acidobacteriota bacterium]